MISLTTFITVLEKGGSSLSSDFNTNILGGVPGMPLTHQIGLGSQHKRGNDVNFVDMDDLNNSTHFRMLLAFGGASITKKIVQESEADLLSIIAGSAAAYFTYTEAKELYQDWIAGFQAAKELNDDYYTTRGIARPACAQKAEIEIPAYMYLQRQHNPQPQLSFIGNQRPRKAKRMMRRQGFSYIGNQSVL